MLNALRFLSGLPPSSEATLRFSDIDPDRAPLWAMSVATAFDSRSPPRGIGERNRDNVQRPLMCRAVLCVDEQGGGARSRRLLDSAPLRGAALGASRERACGDHRWCPRR